MAYIKDAPSSERARVDLNTTDARFYVRADGPTPLIEVGGEIDLSNVDALAGCLSVFEPGDAVIVDVSGLSYIDSQGIAALVMTCNRGVRVVCRGAQGSVRHVIRMCGLDAVLSMED